MIIPQSALTLTFARGPESGFTKRDPTDRGCQAMAKVSGRYVSIRKGSASCADETTGSWSVFVTDAPHLLDRCCNISDSAVLGCLKKNSRFVLPENQAVRDLADEHLCALTSQDIFLLEKIDPDRFNADLSHRIETGHWEEGDDPADRPLEEVKCRPRIIDDQQNFLPRFYDTANQDITGEYYLVQQRSPTDKTSRCDDTRSDGITGGFFDKLLLVTARHHRLPFINQADLRVETDRITAETALSRFWDLSVACSSEQVSKDLIPSLAAYLHGTEFAGKLRRLKDLEVQFNSLCSKFGRMAPKDICAYTPTGLADLFRPAGFPPAHLVTDLFNPIDLHRHVNEDIQQVVKLLACCSISSAMDNQLSFLPDDLREAACQGVQERAESNKEAFIKKLDGKFFNHPEVNAIMSGGRQGGLLKDYEKALSEILLYPLSAEVKQQLFTLGRCGRDIQGLLVDLSEHILRLLQTGISVL